MNDVDTVLSEWYTDEEWEALTDEEQEEALDRAEIALLDAYIDEYMAKYG